LFFLSFAFVLVSVLWPTVVVIIAPIKLVRYSFTTSGSV